MVDIACGIGYGSQILADIDCDYIGVDKPGVPDPSFARPRVEFRSCDIDDWVPITGCDVVLCFETIEHVRYPQKLIDFIRGQGAHHVLASVPTVPTVGINEHHLTDFTEESLPKLFLPWEPVEVWYQPVDQSHVWAFQP